MNNSLSYLSLLLGATAIFAACSGSEDFAENDSPPDQQVWSAIIPNASQGEISVEDSTLTRALFLGGYTDRFLTAWDQGDVVKVYKGNSLVGTMTPENVYWGSYIASLTGTLTGPFSGGDQLLLYLPSKEIDLTGQSGTLQSVSTKSYQTTSVSVATAADNILTLSDVKMTHRLTYVRLRFTDEESGARLHPSQLIIHAISGGHAVLKMDADGNVTETGDIVLNMTQVDNEYPSDIYLAMLNENDAVVTYNFKATVGSDTYIGPLSSENAYGPNIASTKGSLRGAVRKLRKATAMGNEAITVAAISSKVFTGSAIVPEAAEIVVKDGEETLVLDTDYSIAYSDNTGAGTATVTITGLADKYAQAQTKYLGTKVVSFTIEKATPVVTLSSTTAMTLEQDTKQTRTAATVTIGGLDLLTDATYHGTVTYTSDDPSIASVNPTTGEVTGVATGTTTITATVASAANWNAASASYTVKVSPRVNANETSPWTVIEDEEAGEVYQ